RKTGKDGRRVRDRRDAADSRERGSPGRVDAGIWRPRFRRLDFVAQTHKSRLQIKLNCLGSCATTGAQGFFKSSWPGSNLRISWFSRNEASQISNRSVQRGQPPLIAPGPSTAGL